MITPTPLPRLATVNRLEVIDHTGSSHVIGRAFTKWVKQSFTVEYSIQDDGKTLKLFLSEPEKP